VEGADVRPHREMHTHIDSYILTKIDAYIHSYILHPPYTYMPTAYIHTYLIHIGRTGIRIAVARRAFGRADVKYQWKGMMPYAALPPLTVLKKSTTPVGWMVDDDGVVLVVLW
jgi:hypothetical protein